MMRPTRVARELPAGEQKEKARSRRRWQILGALFAAGFVPGAMLGWTLNEDLLAANTVWPAWVAILLVVMFLVAVPIGSWLLHRQLDELERANHYKAAAMGGGVLVIVYPVWWTLWMGDLVREPIHWVLFLLFYAAFIGTWIYYRLR